MQWLEKLVDKIIAAQPDGEILIESGSSPSGTYHLGHLRELVTCDAILIELTRRGRKARHIAYVDDLDALRKVPINVPESYEKYLGKSLCDIPSPEGSGSYGDYFLEGLKTSAKALNIKVEFIHSSQRYREGFFAGAIEQALEKEDSVREILQTISGHELGEQWSPIQINEDGYLKKRRFVSLDKTVKTLTYEDKDGKARTTSYVKGEVKLDWRIDWPARWSLLGVNVEPFGRDHATKGGSYDTGAALCEKVFGAKPPIAVPYDFVNLAGDTKKMSASAGTGLDAAGVVKVLPPEIVRYFTLRYPPGKRLYFDPTNIAQLIDEFAELLAKKDKTEGEHQLLEICNGGIDPIISTVPFSHLFNAYQAALRDPAKTVEIIKRERGDVAAPEQEIIKDELRYIDEWLDNWAPEDVKFELAQKVDSAQFSKADKTFLSNLADQIEKAPKDVDGEWFHKAIYGLKESGSLTPDQVFKPLYQALIGKDSGPRAGWFLSILPRDWLIKRLRFEV